MHVEEAAVAEVQPDEYLARLPAFGGDVDSLDALERGQIADGLRLEVDGVDMEVLVPVHVLHVEEVRAVLGPEVDADPAVGVVRDLGVVILPDGPDPDVEDVLVRGSEVGEAGAVGGDPRRGLDGVAEEHLARDEGRRLRPDGGGAAEGRQSRRKQQKRPTSPLWHGKTPFLKAQSIHYAGRGQEVPERARRRRAAASP